MMSLGFTEENGAQAVVALGVSMIVGKVTLALISDYIPFHQLYLSTLASSLGISVMICLLQAPSLFVIMCTIAGKCGGIPQLLSHSTTKNNYPYMINPKTIFTL